MASRESSRYKRILDAVKAKYPRAVCRKVADAYTRGWPDLEILFPRVTLLSPVETVESVGVLHVEVKTESGRESPLQIETILMLNQIADGCQAIFAEDAADVLAALEDMGAV